MGFAPAEGPRVVIGVFVDEPKGDVFGGEVAAPAFREVAEYAMKMLGVPPTQAAAVPALAAAPEPPEAEPEGPPPVEQVDRRATRSPGGGVAVPSLAGLPLRAAIRRLEEADLAAELAGSGRVVSQSPPPGKVVARGTRVRMTLAPAG